MIPPHLDYRTYACRDENGITSDGASLTWYQGCNGQKHVDTLIKMWFREEDQAAPHFAEEVLIIERGPCDGSCQGQATIGGFIHPRAEYLAGCG